MRPPTTSVMILNKSIGSFFSLEEIVWLMTSAENARNSTGLPNMRPRGQNLSPAVCADKVVLVMVGSELLLTGGGR